MNYQNSRMPEFAPKYHILKEHIKDNIKQGTYKIGKLIPSENVLRKEFVLSNTTVRRALNELEAEGYLTRKQGKGTFASVPAISRSLKKILSFTQNMREMGLTPKTIVLEKTIIKAKGVLAPNLNISAGTPVLVVRRLRFGDDTPLLYETRYIPLSIFPGIEKKDFTRSLYQLFQEDYGTFLKRASQTLKLASASAKVAKMLKIKPRTPVFFVTGVTYSTEETAVEYEQSYYRADKYQFSIEVGNQ